MSRHGLPPKMAMASCLPKAPQRKGVGRFPKGRADRAGRPARLYSLHPKRHFILGTAKAQICHRGDWRARRDSNPRPMASEARKCQ